MTMVTTCGVASKAQAFELRARAPVITTGSKKEVAVEEQYVFAGYVHPTACNML